MQKQKSVQIYRSAKYVAIIAEDVWGASYFSREGWCVFAQHNAGPKWLGANFRKALETSQDFNRLGPLSWDDLLPMEEASNQRRLAFWSDVAREFKYKDGLTAMKKKALVFTEWMYDTTDQVVLRASKRRPGGGHSAWPQDKNQGKVVTVSIHSTDEALGLALEDAFSRCE